MFLSGMAVGWWGPAIGLSHGCLVYPGLRPDGAQCTPDDARKGRRNNPSEKQDVCGTRRRLASVNLSRVLRERLETHPQRYSDPMTKATGGDVFMSHCGAGCGKGSDECRLCRQSNSCQEHHTVLSVDGPAAPSTHHINFGDCYDTTKRVICTTTNHQCPTTRAKDSTFITQRRYGRQNKVNGQHLVPKPPGGGSSSLEVRTVLVVVAMVVGSCHAIPTLVPHSSPSSSRTPQIAHEPPRKGMYISPDI